jgi:acyl carrier protein
VDALQLVVALDKKYGLKIPDPATARKVLQSVTSIAEAVVSNPNALGAEAKSPPPRV